MQIEDIINAPALSSTAPKLHALPQNTETTAGPLNDVSPKVLTVEDFLKRSAEKSGIKTYGKRKRVTAARNRNTDADYSEGESTDSWTPSSPIQENTPELNPKRRKMARFSQRLTRASILAHGNPSERLRHQKSLSTGSGSRKALVFTEEACSPLTHAPRKRTKTLGKPSKAAPFHNTLFPPPVYALPAALTQNVKRKPITEWNMAGQLSTARKVTQRSTTAVKLSPTRIPLSFVPYDAEARASSRSNPFHYVPSPTPERPRPSNPINRIPETFSSLHFVPVAIQSPKTRVKRVTFSLPTHVTDTRGSTSSTLTALDENYTPFANCDTPALDTSTRIDTNYQADQSEPSKDPSSTSTHSRTSPTPTAVDESCSPFTNCVTPALITPTEIDTDHQVDHSEPSKDPTSVASANAECATRKSLRVLSSFLGGFMETARSATRLETSARASGTRRKKRSKPSLTHGPHPPSQLQPLSSMRLSALTSIAPPEVQSEIGSSNPPVLKRSLTAQSRLMMKAIKRTSRDLTQNSPQGCAPVTPLRNSIPATFSTSQLPIIPSSYSARLEILSALQPPRTQVVLSSSPMDKTAVDAFAYAVSY
ncbi:hypothetical protein FIBSPDRAFT_1037600 [Athelia psychrophila]|uniref:Uncharacterized protein n=1 Tax=Athelia psychrophila TaxID=1759441 RepID=A0A166TYJ6_9AGAM|nr:hypothetical protein FIBSPDRAFT_1037600 [Fibularhizoctonia sp. CBS 109695]